MMKKIILNFVAVTLLNLYATVIPEAAFEDRSDVTSYSFEGVTSIGRYAFFGSGLKGRIVIPASVVLIGEGAFDCEGLTEFVVDANNPNYCSVNGILYTKDMKQLWSVPAKKSLGKFTIPEGVERISYGAFSRNMSLEEVTIPNTVTTLGAFCFADTGLKEVYVPDGIDPMSIVGERRQGDPWDGLEWMPFADCLDLEFISIPKSLEHLQDEFQDIVHPEDRYMNYATIHVRTEPDPDDGLTPTFSFLPGRKVSIDIGFVGYTAKGLPSGLKFNSRTGTISGTPKKPTGETGVTVTFTKKGADSLTAVVIVEPIPTVNVTLAGDTEKCRVKGAGKAYLVDKKVSLSATAPKGTAFIGWIKDGEPWPNEAEARKTKLSFAMPEASLDLVATFEKERMSLECPGLEDGTFTVGVVGNADGIPLEISTQSGIKSVKVRNLPKGMKLVKDKASGEWTIVGAPTKAGTYNVTLTVTANSGATETIMIPVTVEALPDWAVGTFGGLIGDGADDDFVCYGMISMKILASGKITAKISAGGKTYSFSGIGFDSVDGDVYSFTLKTKAGDIYAGAIDGAYHDVARLVADEPYDASNWTFTTAAGRSYWAGVWRNEHGKDGRLDVDPTGKAQRVMDVIKAMESIDLREFDPAYGSVTLKIDKKGNVKVSGKTADGVSLKGTSFLMLDDDSYHVIGDMAIYDKTSGNVYRQAICWLPIFDRNGEVVDWDWECCDHALRTYPFE